MGTNERNLEAFTSAIGAELNTLFGVRFTRLRTAASAGATTLEVETYEGWPVSGTIIIGEQLYLYSGKGGTALLPTLTGIQHGDGTGALVAGTKEDHEITAPVIDYSRSFSFMDLLRAAFLVDTAQSSDLSVVGRNVGVDRPPVLENDADFRKVIKALAYARKGTMHAIELALEALFGAGNFTAYEDFATGTNRNTVFIDIDENAIVGTEFQGRAWLNYFENRPYDEVNDEITSTKSGIITAYSVKLADEAHEGDVSAQLPSAINEIRYVGDSGIPVWVFDAIGSGATEGVEITVEVPEGGYTQFDFSAAPGLRARYVHRARIRPESDAYLDVHMKVASFTNNAGDSNWHLRIDDGERQIRMGFKDAGGGNMTVGAVTGAGSFITSAVTFPQNEWATFALRKIGDEVRLERNGAVFQTINRSLFDAVANNSFSFGEPSTTEAPDVYVKGVNFSAQTFTDYWAIRGTNGKTEAASPQTFNTQSTLIVPGDVGKRITLQNSDEVNAEGGNNNGSWIILSVIDADKVSVTGETKQNAFTENANPNRITVANEPTAFQYPDDLGKTILLIGGANPGPHTIDAILDPITNAPFSGTFRDTSNKVTVAGAPAFTTEVELDYRLDPVFVNENPPGSGITWTLSDAGTLTGSVFALRQPIPLTGFDPGAIIVTLGMTLVLSAQLLEDETIANAPVGTWYPFYIAPSALEALEFFLDELTVAGVIPEIL